MFNGDGKAVKEVSREISINQLNDFTLKQPEVHYTSSLTRGGTTPLKGHTSAIQSNFSKITDVESNNTYQRDDLIIENHTSIKIKTPEAVGAGLKTYIAYEQMISDYETTGEILKSLSGIYKMLYCSRYGGTGSALLLFMLLNLSNYLKKYEKLFLINSLPESIQGTPIQKYYLSTAIEQIYTENKPEILSLYMPEHKISSFLESGFLEIINTILSNVINMKGVNKSNKKVVALDYNESDSDDFNQYAFSITGKIIKSVLYEGTDSNTKINHEGLKEELTKYISIDSVSQEDIVPIIQRSRNSKTFEDTLYQRIDFIIRNISPQVNIFSRQLFYTIYKKGFKNLEGTIIWMLNELKSSLEDNLELPNWKKLYNSNKKHSGILFWFFALLEKPFNKKEVAANEELKKAVKYINAEIKNRFISGVAELLQNLLNFFQSDFNDELNYELNIDFNDVEDINDIINPEAFKHLIKYNFDLNYKNILFFYVIHSLDAVRLENYASYEEFNNGIIIQAPFIDSLSKVERNILFEKVKRKYNSTFIDLIPKLRENDLEFRIIRYCFVSHMDRIHIIKQVINQINSSYYDFSKINPIYFACTSKYDLLLSRLRTAEYDYKINNEDIFYFILQCYSLNLLNSNKNGFSISHPHNGIKTYTTLSEVINMLSYNEQEEIRKRFITKFFENPIAVIKKFECLGSQNSVGSGRIIKDPALHKIFEGKLRELLTYSKQYIEILNYLREHYA